MLIYMEKYFIFVLKLMKNGKRIKKENYVNINNVKYCLFCIFFYFRRIGVSS